MACEEPTKHQNSKAAREQSLEECFMIAAFPIALIFHASSRNSRYIYMYLIPMINVFLQMYLAGRAHVVYLELSICML